MSEKIEEAGDEGVRFNVFLAVLSGLLLGLIDVGILWALSKPRSCDAVARLVLGGCVLTAGYLLAPVALTALCAVGKGARRHLASTVLASVLFYAVYVPTVAFVPFWKDVVPNVQRGYREFKVKHPEPAREPLNRQAEWLADFFKPVIEWLAK